MSLHAGCFSVRDQAEGTGRLSLAEQRRQSKDKLRGVTQHALALTHANLHPADTSTHGDWK